MSFYKSLAVFAAAVAVSTAALGNSLVKQVEKTTQATVDAVKAANTLYTGKVLRFDESKGIGFIKVDGTGEEIFVHQANTKTQIRAFDKVQFKIKKESNQNSAYEVSKIK